MDIIQIKVVFLLMLVLANIRLYFLIPVLFATRNTWVEIIGLISLLLILTGIWASIATIIFL